MPDPRGEVERERPVVDVVEVARQRGAQTDGLVAQRELIASGCSRYAVRRALTERRLVALHPGVLAVPPLPERRRWLVEGRAVDRRYRLDARAAVVAGGPLVLLRARTALVLMGAGLLVEPEDVELTVPHLGRRARRAGVDVRQARTLPPRAWLRRGDAAPLPVVAPLAAVRQVAAERPLVEAVVALDALLRARSVTRDEVALAVRQGVLADRVGRQVAARSDAQAGSVLESVARVLFVDAGLRGFRTQVHVRPETVLRVDFLFDAARLVVEVDGDRYHPDGGRDRRRDNLCAATGYRVLRFTWDEVVNQPDLVLGLLREALGR